MRTVREVSAAERRRELDLISNFIRTEGIKVLPAERRIAQGLPGLDFFLTQRMERGRKRPYTPLMRPEIPSRYITLKFKED